MLFYVLSFFAIIVRSIHYYNYVAYVNLINEKALRKTQTQRASCSKAEPKNFAFSGAQDG